VPQPISKGKIFSYPRGPGPAPTATPWAGATILDNDGRKVPPQQRRGHPSGRGDLCCGCWLYLWAPHRVLQEEAGAVKERLRRFPAGGSCPAPARRQGYGTVGQVGQASSRGLTTRGSACQWSTSYLPSSRGAHGALGAARLIISAASRRQFVGRPETASSNNWLRGTHGPAAQLALKAARTSTHRRSFA
jgi:hypothetical protein